MNEENNNNEKFLEPQNVEPEVLGGLRKEKIGKPILVLEMFLLFGVVLVALPIVNKMLQDENSFLSKFINGEPQQIKKIDNTEYKDKILDASKEQLLTYDTTMQYENLILKEFILNGNKLECKMYSANNVINLDNEELYLEVYSSSEQKLGAIKLTGSLDYQEQKYSVTANGLSFNPKYEYKAKVVKMEDHMYPDVKYVKDAEEKGSFTCVMGGRTIEYLFTNDYLTGIKDTDRKKITDFETNEAYMYALRNYNAKANLFGVDKAMVEENSTGFLYSVKIDLEEEGFKYPENINDTNYYGLNSDAKKIHYAQEGKGFDCK